MYDENISNSLICNLASRIRRTKARIIRSSDTGQSYTYNESYILHVLRYDVWHYSGITWERFREQMRSREPSTCTTFDPRREPLLRGLYVHTSGGDWNLFFFLSDATFYTRRFFDSIVPCFSINITVALIKNWFFIHFAIVDLASVNFW